MLAAMPLRFVFFKGRAKNFPCLTVFLIKFGQGLGSASILQPQQIKSCLGSHAALSSITSQPLCSAKLGKKLCSAESDYFPTQWEILFYFCVSVICPCFALFFFFLVFIFLFSKKRLPF